MKRLGTFEAKSKFVNTVIDVNQLMAGVNSIKNHFVVTKFKFENLSVEKKLKLWRFQHQS